MKNIILNGILLLLMVTISSGYARRRYRSGNWDVGGNVAVVPQGEALRLKAAVYGEYSLMALLSWRTDIELIFQDLTQSGEFDISIPSNLLFYPLQHQYAIEPYMGPGLVYTYTYSGDHFLGCNVLGGVKYYYRKGQAIGIEARYTVVDLLNWTATDNFAVGLIGKWELEF